MNKRRMSEELNLSLQEVLSAPYGDFNSNSELNSTEIYEEPNGFSDLQELTDKIDKCLELQAKVRFITREISEIIKRQA